MAIQSENSSEKPGLKRVLARLGSGVQALVFVVSAAWMTGVLHYELSPHVAAWSWLLAIFLLGVLAWSCWRYWRKKQWRLVSFLITGIAAVFVWFSFSPENDRDWQADVAFCPQVEQSGEVFKIRNFRDFDYKSETDYTSRWSEKTVSLSKLQGIDFFTSYWGLSLICHTIVSFDFGKEGIVCVSIETRKEKGEEYSTIGGFLRQYELYYVVGSERDIIQLRSNHREEDVFRYRLNVKPERMRELFKDYVESINELAATPKWYNALTSNCTSNIRVHAKSTGKTNPWNWRMLANGYLDQFLFDSGRLVLDFPGQGFENLKAAAKIDRHDSSDPSADFSKVIRKSLKP